jgi:hypothetical protein
MLAYYINHLVWIQSRFVARDAVLQRLVTIYQLLEQDETEEGLALPAKLTMPDQARECIENMEDYLLRKKDETGCPLLYIIRLLVALPLPADDPGFGLPSFSEEMITRAPHVGPEYEHDNRLVWDLVRYVTHGGPAWDWVSAFARTFDWRNAFLAMKMHYLGPTFQALIRAQADQRLDNAFYNAKSRNFTFESYCTLLQHAFTDLEQAGDPLSELWKVRFFERHQGYPPPIM